jgi:hypothetical protein
MTTVLWPVDPPVTLDEEERYGVILPDTEESKAFWEDVWENR